MKTFRNIVFGSCALFGLLEATGVLVAQRVSPSVTSVPVCIKDNGQVRVLIEPDATCATSELRTEWAVGRAERGR